jgi:hypothetical protein
MKYIIKESQYNRLFENKSNKIEMFQDLIDDKLNYIRRVCAKGADDYEGDVGEASCDQIEQVEKVKVTEADWVTVKHSNKELEHKYMNVKIMIYYSSIRRGQMDADDLTYDLEKILRTKTTMPILLNYETTNTNKDFNW